ncbi:hypothetical protein DWV13_03745 [Clostridium botulinum]|uniref:hypothetical protein n=1 Tax=Clostridium TaxID=1485 RepID=UPI0013FCB9BA|nr:MULTISPECIES: hypothetical protein [Clostridium]MCS6130775.1 hypothetical protein [Clostridium botulinum]NFL44737.1 hypothetical protein [Clostridium botulinum]NFL91077.1 hypothetical protein [Clostridium botulinum]
MILSDFDKEVIDKIISEEINDIASFIKWKYDDEKINIVNRLGNILDSDNNKYGLSFSSKNYDNEDINIYSGNLPKRTDIYCIDNLNSIGRFISLWKKLEKEGYIFSTNAILNSTQLACYMKREKRIDISSNMRFKIKSENIEEYKREYKKAHETFYEIVEKVHPGLSDEEKKKKTDEGLSNLMECIKTEHEHTYESINESIDDIIEIPYKDNYFDLIQNDELINYVGAYIDKTIIQLNELKELKNNKYESIMDIRFKAERNERRISQVVTVLIAIASIIINLYITSTKNNNPKELNKEIEETYQSQEDLNKTIEKSYQSQDK